MTAPRRLNVLLMIADDHRHGAIRAQGDAVVQTPTMDRLMAEGVSFERTYHFGGLTGGVCVPARACLMAGANPFRALASKDLADAVGLRTINPTLTTLPETFRNAGYHSFHVGKWHNDTASFQRSFDGGDRIFMGGMSDHYRVPIFDFDPTAEYPREKRYEGDAHSTELFGQAAVQFLEGYDRPEPFFFYLAFTAPHDPRTPPPEYAALYPPAEVPVPPNFLAEHPFDNGDLRVRDEALAPWPRTREEVQRHTADYYGMITHLDAWIGNVLCALEHIGRAQDTIVVYTADHGLAVGQHGLFGKQNLYEHSARVPCIVRAPGVQGGRREYGLAHTPDLNPTLCELAGVEAAETVEARSLTPILRGETERHRPTVCQVYKDVQRMVTDGRWKLIRYYRSAERPNAGTDGIQLFDLDQDPWETNDLTAEPACAKRIERLAAVLAEWQREVEDPLQGVPVLPAPPLAGVPAGE
ncbi:MAG: sulfatase-like hydrolase/transferase [Chloroflexota bacterium]